MQNVLSGIRAWLSRQLLNGDDQLPGRNRNGISLPRHLSIEGLGGNQAHDLSAGRLKVKVRTSRDGKLTYARSQDARLQVLEFAHSQLHIGSASRLLFRQRVGGELDAQGALVRERERNDVWRR